jgi:heme-degrading monooxygenase HmoA
VEEFVERWRQLARTSLDAYEGVGPARLWQDRDDPTRFVSLIAWQDFEQIERFLADPAFAEIWAGLIGLTESGERRPMELREIVD